MEPEDLLALVTYIVDPPEGADEEDVHNQVERFVKAIPHPAGTDLLYYPEHWGLPRDLTPEGVVAAALSWKPRAIVMRVTQVRPHPDDDRLRGYAVVVDGAIRTQVVAEAGIGEGESVVVALSGCRLRDGTNVAHSFVGRAFSVGKLVEVTSLPPGSDVTSAYCM